MDCTLELNDAGKKSRSLGLPKTARRSRRNPLAQNQVEETPATLTAVGGVEASRKGDQIAQKAARSELPLGAEKNQEKLSVVSNERAPVLNYPESSEDEFQSRADIVPTTFQSPIQRQERSDVQISRVERNNTPDLKSPDDAKRRIQVAADVDGFGNIKRSKKARPQARPGYGKSSQSTISVPRGIPGPSSMKILLCNY